MKNSEIFEDMHATEEALVTFANSLDTNVNLKSYAVMNPLAGFHHFILRLVMREWVVITKI